MPSWLKTSGKWILMGMFIIIAIAIPVIGIIYYRNAYLKEKAQRVALNEQGKEAVKAETQVQVLEVKRDTEVTLAEKDYAEVIAKSEERIEEIKAPPSVNSTPGSRLQDLIDKGDL